MALTTEQQQGIIKTVVATFNGSVGVTFMNLLSVYGSNVGQLYIDLANSTAFQGQSFAFSNASTNTQFATAITNQLIGTSGQYVTPTNHTAAVDYIRGLLDAGTHRGTAIKTAVDALSTLPTTDSNWGNAVALLNNRVTVATDYTITQSGSSTSISTLQSTISTVTNTQASVDAAIAANVPTTTFTLTTGVDTLTGTSGNDTFVGSTAYDANEAITSASTYTVVDTLNGAGGTDTLSLTISGAQDAAVTIPSASISNVEILSVRNTVAQTASIDASTIAGLTAVNTDRSVGVLTVTNLASGASAGMKGDGTVANAAFNAGYVAGATAATLNISGGTTAGAVTLSGTGLTSTTVNSTIASNTIGALALAATTTTMTVDATTALTTGAVTNTGGAALATLNVKGAGAVSFGSTALESAVTKIDASAHTGGLTVALGSAVTQVVTGGSGNDTITSGAVLTTGSVNGGDGTDILNLGSNVSHANTASLAAKYTNFETLRLSGTFDASLIAGITAIQLLETSTISKMNATQAAAVSVRANISGSTTLALTDATGSSDALTMTMGTGGSGTGAAFDIAGALVVTGFETLNMKANGGATATTGANRTVALDTAITGASLTAINLTGTAFSFANIATSKAVTVDATALTGDGATTAVGLTVAGSAKAGSVINGSAVKDVYTIGAEGSTYNGNAGSDTFTTTAAILNADGTTDAVLNGGTGTDTLTLTGTQTVTDVHFTNVTAMEKLTTAETSAVSYTGLGAAFKAAYADGVTVTSGTLADNATYTFGGGLYDKAVTLTLVSSGVGNTTADNIAITTGAGVDTISVDASAAWVGATGGAAGQITVATGAGNDTISVSTGTLVAHTVTTSVTITGGTGADAITAVGVNAASGLTPTFVIAAGDSTTTAYDSITGFDAADGSLFSSTLDFTTVALNAYSATAATGYTAAELTVAVSAAGLVTLAGTAASGLTLDQKIAAIQSVVTTVAGDSALLIHGTNAYVFNNNSSGDSVVELVGLSTATALITANATTANAIFIA